MVLITILNRWRILRIIVKGWAEKEAPAWGDWGGGGSAAAIPMGFVPAIGADDLHGVNIQSFISVVWAGEVRWVVSSFGFAWGVVAACEAFIRSGFAGGAWCFAGRGFCARFFCA
jgi:hypothetical protein